MFDSLMYGLIESGTLGGDELSASDPLLLTGVALSSGAALGVALVLLAARGPDRAERFARKYAKNQPKPAAAPAPEPEKKA